MPRKLVSDLREQIEFVRKQHATDVEQGVGQVWLPYAMQRKASAAACQFDWQYLFASPKLSHERRPREADEGHLPDDATAASGDDTRQDTAGRAATQRGTVQLRRHHVHDTTVQRAVGAAVRKAGINKRASCHSLRHSFARHLPEDGKDIRTIQELLGYADVNSTMTYTRVSALGATGVCSPLDRL